jgi:hypothetical protein
MAHLAMCSNGLTDHPTVTSQIGIVASQSGNRSQAKTIKRFPRRLGAVPRGRTPRSFWTELNRSSVHSS